MRIIRLLYVCIVATAGTFLSTYPQLKQKQIQAIENRTYPPEWGNQNFSHVIQKLKGNQDPMFFIQWCNAMLEGMKSNFYQNKKPHDLLIQVLQQLKKAKNRKKLNRIVKYYIDHTQFKTILINSLQEYIDRYSRSTLIDILETLSHLNVSPHQNFLDKLQAQLSKKLPQTQTEKKTEHRAILNSIQALFQIHTHLTNEFKEQWFHSSRENLEQFNPQDLASSMHMIAVHGIKPPKDWINAWINTSREKLEQFKPQDLSNSIYGLAQLKKQPPKNWINSWFDISYEKIKQFQPQDLSNSIYALAQLKKQPPKDWINSWFDISYNKIKNFNAQALYNSIYALTQLNIKPQQDWIDTWLKASYFKLPGLNQQSLANIIHAMTQFETRPPENWMNKWFTVSHSKLAQSSQQDLFDAGYALAQLDAKPPNYWKQQWVNHFHSTPDDLSPQELSKIIYIHAQLNITPQESWINSWLEVAHSKLDQFNSQELSNSIYALSQLKITLQENWINAWFRAANNQNFIPQELSNSVYAFTHLNIDPPRDWKKQWLNISHDQHKQRDPNELSKNIHILARLRITPQQNWLNKWFKAFYAKLDHFDLQEISNSIYSLVILHTNFKESHPELSNSARNIAHKIIVQLKQTDNLESLIAIEQTNIKQQLLWAFYAIEKYDLHERILKNIIQPQQPQPSGLQKTISKHLRNICNKHNTQIEEEYYIKDLATYIDFAIPEHNIAIEIDGPYHFFALTQRYLSKNTLKTYLLEKLGWRVVRIPYFEWNQHKNKKRNKRDDYLKTKIKTVQPNIFEV